MESIAKCVVRDGDLSLVSDRWIIGLGVGSELFEEYAGPSSEVTGKCRVVRSFTKIIEGRKITLIASAGGGIYVEGLVGLAAHSGVKYILGLGACGSLRRDVRIGDVLLAAAAMRGENLTDYYVPKSYPAVADNDLLLKVKTALETSGLRPRVSIVYTTPSILTEDPSEMRKLGELGVDCIECETSILYILTRLAGIKSAVVLVVSDNVVEGKGLSNEAEIKAYKETLRKVLDLLVNVAVNF